MSRDVRLLLEDIIEAGQDIASTVAGVDFGAFAASVEKRAAVERMVFVIGEAAARLPTELHDQYPAIPWREIIGMRNILAHAYWKIDRKVLWDAAVTSVPALIDQIRLISV